MKKTDNGDNGDAIPNNHKSPRPAGKPKKKPDYDPDSMMEELLAAAVNIYEAGKDCGNDNKRPSLRKVSEALEEQGYGSNNTTGKLNPAKVKKLLITAEAYYHRTIYASPVTEKIQQLRKQGKTVEQIMESTGLSRAAVNNNMPYEKVVYRMDTVKAVNGGSGGEVSVNADRVRLYKKRKKALEDLKAAVNGENLWVCFTVFENYPFTTSSGLPFTYSFKLNRHGTKGNEIVVSRKAKTVTRSSVEMALAAVVKLGQEKGYPVKMSTPKELNVFGASYIYPLFIRFGLVEHIGSDNRGGRGKRSK